jgi:hypothetical protein
LVDCGAKDLTKLLGASDLTRVVAIPASCPLISAIDLCHPAREIVISVAGPSFEDRFLLDTPFAVYLVWVAVTLSHSCHGGKAFYVGRHVQTGAGDRGGSPS